MDHMELAMSYVVQLQPDQLRSLIAHAVGLHADKMGPEPTVRAVRNITNALDEQVSLERMEDIARQVAHEFGVTLLELRSRQRHHFVSHARQEAMWRMRQVKWPDGQHRYSFPQIGRYFGLDHSTVHHGVAQTARRKAKQQVAE